MKTQPTIIAGRIKLKHFDPAYCGGLAKAKTKELTAKFSRRIDALLLLLYANSSHAVLLLFQGMDASGKDDSIRSVFQHMNPAGISCPPTATGTATTSSPPPRSRRWSDSA